MLALRLLHFRSAPVAILMLPVGVLMGLPMMQKNFCARTKQESI